MKGRQVIIVRQPQKEEKKTTTPVAVEKDYDVKGTIVDVSGQPLPGVNITVQGTTTGVTTDIYVANQRWETCLVSSILHWF